MHIFLWYPKSLITPFYSNNIFLKVTMRFKTILQTLYNFFFFFWNKYTRRQLTTLYHANLVLWKKYPQISTLIFIILTIFNLFKSTVKYMITARIPKSLLKKFLLFFSFFCVNINMINLNELKLVAENRNITDNSEKQIQKRIKKNT